MTINLANELRPQTFDDILGQDNIKRFFKNSLSQNRIRSVYMLPGLHGSGKTTTAKVLSRWLNCEDRKDYNPCNQCRQCLAAIRGQSPHIMEVDGTSQNKQDFVENELMMFLSSKPPANRYNVAIIDEFHRIKDPARSMFLPFLEFLDTERPRSIVILCTTDIKSLDKALCSRMVIPGVFQGLNPEDVAERYASKLGLVPETCKLILRVSGGSMRQFWNTYDVLKEISGDTQITDEMVLEWVGGISKSERGKLWKAVQKNDKASIKKLWETWMTSNKAGFDFVATQLLEDLDQMVVNNPDEDRYVRAHQQLATTLTFVNDSRAKVDQLVLGSLYAMFLPEPGSKPTPKPEKPKSKAQQAEAVEAVYEEIMQKHEVPKPVVQTIVQTLTVPVTISGPDLDDLGESEVVTPKSQPDPIMLQTPMDYPADLGDFGLEDLGSQPEGYQEFSDAMAAVGRKQPVVEAELPAEAIKPAYSFLDDLE